MSLWRLEYLRWVRTKRILWLTAVHVFFGVTGPVSIRYVPELLERLQPDMPLPPLPVTPEAALGDYQGNALQIGLLVAAFLAASAISVDGKPPIAVFFRTRLPARRFLTPRVAAAWLAAVVAYSAGLVAAWATTERLIGDVPEASLLGGMVLTWVFLAFAVVAVLGASSLVRSVPMSGVLALGFLLVLGIAGAVPRIGDWLPGELAGAVPGILTGATSWRTGVVGAGGLGVLIGWAALRRLERREI